MTGVASMAWTPMDPCSDFLASLIDRWKADPGATYRSWFLWDERLKNFRSIRRGLAAVVREIEAGTFGNAYRGSSLETVVESVAEQRRIFKGADHAFLWKPKLRIPDIYEDRDNQRAFAALLHACECCDDSESVVAAIHRIDAIGIKGLGPAVANLLYFIHPTIVVPFNTAIVKGYNALTGSNVKLGRWDHYLALREGALRMNQAHRSQLSNDLGAMAGLMFDVGSGRYPAPPRDSDPATRAAWEADLALVREESAASARLRLEQQASDTTHHEMQGCRWTTVLEQARRDFLPHLPRSLHRPRRQKSRQLRRTAPASGGGFRWRIAESSCPCAGQGVRFRRSRRTESARPGPTSRRGPCTGSRLRHR